VGLVCRVLEEAGIPTVCLSTGRDLTEQVRPPGNFPMGNAFGAPFDIDMQMAVLRAVLACAVTSRVAGTLVDLPLAWPRLFAFEPGKSRM